MLPPRMRWRRDRGILPESINRTMLCGRPKYDQVPRSLRRVRRSRLPLVRSPHELFTAMVWTNAPGKLPKVSLMIPAGSRISWSGGLSRIQELRWSPSTRMKPFSCTTRMSSPAQVSLGLVDANRRFAANSPPHSKLQSIVLHNPDSTRGVYSCPPVHSPS